MITNLLPIREGIIRVLQRIRYTKFFLTFLAFPPSPPPPPRAGSINNDWHDWLPSDLMYGNRSRGRFRTIFNEDVFTFLLAVGNLDRLTKCM